MASCVECLGPLVPTDLEVLSCGHIVHSRCAEFLTAVTISQEERKAMMMFEARQKQSSNDVLSGDMDYQALLGSGDSTATVIRRCPKCKAILIPKSTIRVRGIDGSSNANYATSSQQPQDQLMNTSSSTTDFGLLCSSDDDNEASAVQQQTATRPVNADHETPLIQQLQTKIQQMQDELTTRDSGKEQKRRECACQYAIVEQLKKQMPSCVYLNNDLINVRSGLSSSSTGPNVFSSKKTSASTKDNSSDDGGNTALPTLQKIDSLAVSPFSFSSTAEFHRYIAESLLVERDAKRIANQRRADMAQVKSELRGVEKKISKIHKELKALRKKGKVVGQKRAAAGFNADLEPMSLDVEVASRAPPPVVEDDWSVCHSTEFPIRPFKAQRTAESAAADATLNALLMADGEGEHSHCRVREDDGDGIVVMPEAAEDADENTIAFDADEFLKEEEEAQQAVAAHTLTSSSDALIAQTMAAMQTEHEDEEGEEEDEDDELFLSITQRIEERQGKTPTTSQKQHQPREEEDDVERTLSARPEMVDLVADSEGDIIILLDEDDDDYHPLPSATMKERRTLPHDGGGGGVPPPAHLVKDEDVESASMSAGSFSRMLPQQRSNASSSSSLLNPMAAASAAADAAGRRNFFNPAVSRDLPRASDRAVQRPLEFKRPAPVVID